MRMKEKHGNIYKKDVWVGMRRKHERVLKVLREDGKGEEWLRKLKKVRGERKYQE